MDRVIDAERLRRLADIDMPNDAVRLRAIRTILVDNPRRLLTLDARGKESP